MNYNELEPKNVFHWFYELNQIPRGSGNEKAVSDFLVDFAKKRNLEVEQDSVWNVIIKKKASKGYENSIPVIIQGHMDMVCVKNDGVEHDFLKDPIKMSVDGDWIKAAGTTLGGDDGIAVAYALAVLDGDFEHPPLEVLITTNEETGMDGAAAIKAGQLKGKRLLNIDSELEGIFLVSCAGGATVETKFPAKEEATSKAGLSLHISGLKGGHSGQEIDKQRGNSNKLLFRILDNVRKVTGVQVATVKGGSKHNAIPDEAICTFVADDVKVAADTVTKIAALIKQEYIVEEPGLKIEVEKASVKSAIVKEESDALIDFFVAVPNGVMMMSKDIQGLVQTSLNNAVVMQDAGKVVLETSVRSSSESELDSIIDMIEVIGKHCKASVEQTNRYPAWQFDQKSSLRDLSLKTYKDLFNKEATYSAIHAGLECGLLKKVLPDCDMISYGPDMHDIHSPKERLSVSSSRRLWDFTVALLKNMK